MEIKTGVILRRGTSGLRAEHLKYLLDNEDKVQAILDEIDARRVVFIDTEAKAKARVDEAERVEAGLVKREAGLAKTQDTLNNGIAKAEAKHQGDMAALSRRTSEVVVKEEASDELKTALDARAQQIEDDGRKRETELAAREEAVEAREAACDDRELSLQEQATDLVERQRRLETAAKMVKQAVVGLG